MGQIGIWQILIIALVILVLFGRGRISEMMGDFGKGVSSFKKGLNDDEKPSQPAGNLESPKVDASPTANETKSTDQQG
ncbi:twin-arginine translocase TatA/TatE family subunit [Parerythrobacter aestuarii]|uniref:twin-arginine translocase TatA/TatE family subunit n=1 Tax=Parerythrobacter aestuarii TaxID=3020909 RepID=UPI0024DEC5D9|nr:twin-arginine translocase TatA/TatE family subunit [Parerythrobacter aestuarii]